MTGLKPSDYRVGQSVEWDPGDGVWVPARVVVLHVEDDGLPTPYEFLELELYTGIRRRCCASETKVWVRPSEVR
jgi:hypothetical protein